MPPLPHAVSLSAVWQTPALVQVAQLASLQAPPVQVAAPRHPVQAAPPIPQTAVVVPPWHVPLVSQQPAQLWAQLTLPPPAPPDPPLPPEPPPAPLVQTLFVQVCEPVQTLQEVAPVPHADEVAPLWHFWVESQQPPQLAAEHEGVAAGLQAGADSMAMPSAETAKRKRTCFIGRNPQ